MDVKNLGPISSGSLKLAPLTILCGTNNQGKTYFSYALYGVMKKLPDLIVGFLDEEEYTILRSKGSFTLPRKEFNEKIIKIVSENFHSGKYNIFNKIFNSENDSFNDTEFLLLEEEIYSLLSLDKTTSSIIKVGNTTFLLESGEDNLTILITNDELDDFLSSNRIKTFVDVLIKNAIRKNISSFYIPAERLGINVFRSQLNSNKIEMLDAINNIINSEMRSKNSIENSLIKNLASINNVYPQPINDYLEFINGIQKYEIDDDNEVAMFIRENIIKGRFVIDSNTDKSYYRLRVGKKRYKTDLIPLHITSSSVKSIYGLDYLFEQIKLTQENFIIIDEPEMNLHPKNQLEFANLLDLIISKGIKVIISTHSDFLIRKVQNLMLKNEIEDNSIGLNSSNVKIYNFENSTISNIDLLADDEVFDNFNEIVDLIENEYLDLLEMKAQINSKK